MRKTRHTPKLIITIAGIIITGTFIERYIWIAGVNFSGTMNEGIHSHGNIPYLAVLLVVPVVAAIGFFIVRATMRRQQLLKA